MINMLRNGGGTLADPGFPAYLQGRVAVLTAYFDESAKGDDLLVVGGFVSTSEKWVRFTEECERIKAEFSIPYIHAVKLFEPKSTRLYGHLSMQNRLEVAAKLTHAIISFAEFGILETVVPRRFNRLTTKEWRSKHYSAYGACFNCAFVTLSQYLCPNDEEQTVSIFIEDGHPNIGGALEVIREYKELSDEDPDFPKICEFNFPLKIGGYGVLTKEVSPPLWAADLLAYSTVRQVVQRDEFFTDVVSKIEESVPILGTHIDLEMIQEIKDVAIWGTEKRVQWEKDTHELVTYLHKFGVVPIRRKNSVVLEMSHMTTEQIQKLLEAKNPYDEI